MFRLVKTAYENVDQKMEQLYELGDMGLAPAVSEKDKTELLELLTNVGKTGEQFLGDAQEKGEDLNQGIYRVVNQMQGMLAKDYQSISGYNPENSINLPVLQELARTKTIDLRGKEISTLGNMQSSRIPMTFRGANGEMRTGVFTKANYVQVKAPFLEKLALAKAQCGPEGAEELDRFLSKAKAYHVRMKSKKYDGYFLDKTSDDFMAAYVLNTLRYIRREKGSSKLKAPHLKEYMQKVGVDLNKIPDAALKTLAAGLGEMTEKPGYIINGYGLELKDGQRLDNRNSAMSAVADLLGAGSLLARSSNMRFVGENGEVTEGTFMDYGKGLELGADADSIKHLNNHPLDNPKTYNQALKSIADLQILDALCLNVDRHQGNVMYRVDAKGNFIGVQGIDNDSSFGPRTITMEDVMENRVVSKSMADKINSLTPEMLKFTLRGRGLNEAEINAAGERLSTIKDCIAYGMLRIVPDDQFCNLQMDEMLPKHGDNMFYRALRQVNEAAERRKALELPFVPLKTDKAPHLTDVAATGRKFTVGGLDDLRSDVSLLLRNEKTGFKVEDLSGIRGSSQAFKDMVEAAQLVEYAGVYLKENDPDVQNRNSLMLDDPKAQKSVKVYHNVFMNMREKVSDYLAGKMEQRGAKTLAELKGKNNYEKARINYAKKLLAITDRYMEQVDGTLTPEEREERARLLELRSTGERIAFNRHYKSGDEQPIMSKEEFEAKHDHSGKNPDAAENNAGPEQPAEQKPLNQAQPQEAEPQGPVLT